MMRNILSFSLIFCFVFGQPAAFAQEVAQLDLSGHHGRLQTPSESLAKFRPAHLRYLSYQPEKNKFRLLLDRGDNSGINKAMLNTSTQKLLEYFFIGLALPNDSFWVNLRPDFEDNMIDDDLGKTDVGKILLEADLNLKKDTARLISPETTQGQQYWERLYKKTEELFGSSNINIPTISRPWIVPDEILMRETEEGTYIYKATLKVMLEQDYLKGSGAYNLKDERFKKLNEYAAELMREIIVPQLNQKINSAREYSALRQVYYSLILAQWFKQRFVGRYGAYVKLINARVVSGLASKTPWSKDNYFKEYLESIQEGEYKATSARQKSDAKPPRRFFSGGIQLNMAPMHSMRVATPVTQPVGTKVPAINFLTGPQMPRVELVRVDRLAIPTTLLVKTGNVRKVLPVAETNTLPINILSGPKVFDLSLEPEKLEAANLAVAEVDLGGSIPIASFPSMPAINTNVAVISRGIQIDIIVSRLKRELNIIDAANDIKLISLAQLVAEAKGAEIADNKIPDLPGIPKSEVKLALARITSNVIASSPVLSLGEFKIILSEITRIPDATLSPQAIENIPTQQIPIIDVSNRKVPVSLGRITSVYNWDADRLTIQATIPLELMIAEGQKVTVIVPSGVKNVAVAKMTMKGHPILLVSPAGSSAVAIADLFKTSMPIKIEYVLILASADLAAKINKAEFARKIQAASVDIVTTEPEVPQKIAVVSDGVGAVIIESAGYSKVLPLEPAEINTALTAASPILDVQAIRADIIKQMPVQAATVRPQDVPEIRDLGGVDLRSMKIITQNAAVIRALSKPSGVDIEAEGRQIRSMVHKGVVPSGQRIREYAEAVSQNSNLEQRSRAFGYLTDILRLEEERALPTRTELTEALVLLESPR